MPELAKECDCPIRFPFTAKTSGEWGKLQRYVRELLKEFKLRQRELGWSIFPACRGLIG